MKGWDKVSNLQIFKNPEFGSIRVVEIENEPYFVGKDVAEILGYTNPQKAIRDHVDEEDKTLNELFTVNGTKGILINESGLYSLILSSKLSTAKKFKRWVTSEVLPTIRKHGAYMTPETIERALSNPDFIIELATRLKEEHQKRQALEAESAQQKQLIAELKPKASYYDVVLQTKDVVSIGKIAKDYGKSAQWLNEKLHELGVQYKQGNIWLLYQKYAEQGYTKSKTHTYSGDDGMQHSKLHTYWTQKGRLFIYDLLKSKGILPLIEQESRGIA